MAPATAFPAAPYDLPVRVPEPMRPEHIEPDHGFQIALGSPFLTLRSEETGAELGSGPLFARGAELNAMAVWSAARLGYARSVYRGKLTSAAQYKGDAFNFVGIESDQLWLFHGLRAGRAWFFGYGLGVQQRLVQLRQCSGRDATTTCSDVAAVKETLGIGALMIEWSFATPFSLQLRETWDESGHLLSLSGHTVLLAYIVPF
ncbi:MAG: hypothetical protein HY423_01505 [Candidatus Lambdaproteobacteria bacterium]|nr:hypothetical protein [Candidatus Lambdaproteobacteria bacterium]